ncbi:DNA polymerase kappa-like isoform X2 [Dysidea avara]|uniref:DNA polymerase kappa-like isoform X2 n=1 Tax=Dysidea avara TaxID=196820 RepID=UPI00331F6CBF
MPLCPPLGPPLHSLHTGTYPWIDSPGGMDCFLELETEGDTSKSDDSSRMVECLGLSENSCESTSSLDTDLPSPIVKSPALAATSCSSGGATAPLSRMGLNVHKAGMEGLDRERINEIILSASKGSKYYENEVKKESQLTSRINQLLAKMKQLTDSQKSSALIVVDKEIETLERSRTLNRVIVHIDMDAFYAAVEIRDDPSLREVPMAVGGQSMLSTSNYLARRYGVRAAMPGFIAKKLCPNLVIVKGNYDKYITVSKQVGEILSEYDPNFSQAGIDEAYLDLTAYVQEITQNSLSCGISTSEVSNSLTEDNCDDFESSWSTEIPEKYWQLIQDTVKEIRDRVFARTKLTASAGIAPNMLLAKIASDMNKPNGQYFLVPTRESVLEFVHKLSIRKVSGIGKVSERMLNALDVQTCKDIYDRRAIIYLLFSKSMFQFLLRACLGLGSIEVCTDYERKSISTERTFSEINKPEELEQKCLELCKCLADDLAHKNLKGHQITLKMKTVQFVVKSRSTPTTRPVSCADELYKVASDLLRTEIQSCSPQPLRLRLMGVRVSSLSKKDIGKQTLDYYTQLSHEPEQQTSSVLTSANDHSVTTISGTESSSSSVTCPVCNKLVQCDNDLLNKHIDVCLNRQVIASDDTVVSSPKTKKHKSISMM